MTTQPDAAGPTDTERITALEAKTDSIGDKLDAVLAAVSGKTPASSDGAGDGGGQAQPQDAAAEVRRQLEERDRKAAADKAQADADAWKTGVDASLAELREKPPQEPVRRVEQAMWGRR
jgi:hypothetical protein